MPNCDFYALREDNEEILAFVFDQPGWLLYELSSQRDRPATPKAMMAGHRWRG